MDKLIQFIRYVFYYHLLHLFLGGLSVILILIITDEMANTPMLHSPKLKINKRALTQIQAKKSSPTSVEFFVCGMMGRL